MTEAFARFTTHDLTPQEIAACEQNRHRGLRLVHSFMGTCPDSDERAKAIDAVDQAVMWANAAIARHGR